MEGKLEEAFTISVSPPQWLLPSCRKGPRTSVEAAGTEGNVSAEKQPPHLGLYHC